MAIVSFATALAIFAFTYCLYHYLGPDYRFGTVFQTTPVKPLVTLYCGILGVLHHFAAVVSLMIGLIFFPKDDRN